MEYRIQKPPPEPPAVAILTLSKDELALIHNAVSVYYYMDSGPSQRLCRQIAEAIDEMINEETK